MSFGAGHFEKEWMFQARRDVEFFVMITEKSYILLKYDHHLLLLSIDDPNPSPK